MCGWKTAPDASAIDVAGEGEVVQGQVRDCQQGQDGGSSSLHPRE